MFLWSEPPNGTRLAEALGALRVNLSKSDLDAIEAIVPAGAAAGDRYNAYLMGDLDSEKPAASPIGVGASCAHTATP